MTARDLVRVELRWRGAGRVADGLGRWYALGWVLDRMGRAESLPPIRLWRHRCRVLDYPLRRLVQRADAVLADRGHNAPEGEWLDGGMDTYVLCDPDHEDAHIWEDHHSA